MFDYKLRDEKITSKTNKTSLNQIPHQQVWSLLS